MQEDDRRLANVVVGSIELIDLLTNSTSIMTGLPADTTIVGYYISADYDGLVIRVKSKEFAVVEQFMSIPYITPELVTLKESRSW